MAEAIAPETGNQSEFTVSELSFALKRSVEDAFGFVRVRGEISGLKRAASGHLYLSLKDADAVLDGVCWRGKAERLKFPPEDGLEVVCSGKLTTYPGRSKYQIVIDNMEPAGAGALMALLEERRRKLAGEGLFDPDRKRPIPFLPKVIGVVTSPTGAVFRDILHRIGNRFPREILLWPVLVQGDSAAAQIAAAVEGFNNLPAGGAVPRPDVIIVARGGGSVEDLWAFNEEAVVRAVANSEIPTISAVGHETDTTLVDFASDLRAPTPTAAAEFAVPVRDDLAYMVADFQRRLGSAVNRGMAVRTQRLEGLARGLRGPQARLDLLTQKFDELSDRLPRALSAGVSRRRVNLAQLSGRLQPLLVLSPLTALEKDTANLARRLDQAGQRRLSDAVTRLSTPAKLLESLGYKSILQRGYAVVHRRDADRQPGGQSGGKPGGLVTSAGDAAAGLAVSIEFGDGRADAVFETAAGISSGTGSSGAGKKPPKKTARRKKPVSDDGQGTLL